MTAGTDRSWAFASSTRLGFTHDSIVEAHFHACRPQYLDCLRRVGIRPGWHVLDAGCGGGAFLPWIARLAGAGGRVSAVDLAPELAALAAERVRRDDPPCPVEVTAANLLDLPFPDASFDAVWCANAVQYLTDEELTRALGELRRVVRPGGRVAVKELDVGLITVRPGQRFVVADFFRSAAAGPGYARQLLRSPDLHRWLAAAGLTAVRQTTTLVEHYAPLSAAARAFYGPTCAALARQAEGMGIGEQWTAFLDPDGPANPLNDPRGHITEGVVLAVGSRPATQPVA